MNGFVHFVEYRIKSRFIDIKVPAIISAGHLHTVKPKDDMKRIYKIMGMLGIGENPADVRIIELQVGVKSTVIHLDAPVVLGEAPFISRREVAVSNPRRDTGCPEHRDSQI